MDAVSALLFKVVGVKDEISYPDSFIMVRLTRPSNFKFPGLISLSVFLRKLGLFSLI